jgi:hypothetical protein
MTTHLTEVVSIRGLHTLVAVPDTPPRAVLITRTPYDAEAHKAEAGEWARRGIVVVTQDVRGRYRSAGSFCPFENEGADGVATLEWVLAQSWCPAMVILYGTSYAAHCAVDTAVAAMDAGLTAVGGVSVAVPALGFGETARNGDGSFYLESRLGWWLEHGDGDVSPAGVIPDGVLSTLPVAGMGRAVDPPITAWDNVIRAVRTDRARAEKVSGLSCPLLAIGGTSDWFAQDTIDLWAAWGGPASLVLGPWDHSLRGSARARRMDTWIDSVLAARPAVGAQVHDRPGHMVQLDRWPSALVQVRLGGGRFHSDPADPFPSAPTGADLQAVVTRSDCLVLEVPARTGTIVGTPAVRIYCRPKSGHWSALLAIRRRDGRLEQIAHGMSPHSAIRLTPTVSHLEPGESMAVIVSAHSFPRHSRDLQSGEDHLTGTSMQKDRRDVTAVVVELPA